MERENFRIAFDGQEVIKHKWNACRKEVEKIVRDIARNENTAYCLTGHTAHKEGFYHTSGSMQWTSKAGRVVSFSINKL
jgi:hypothetical protein